MSRLCEGDHRCRPIAIGIRPPRLRLKIRLPEFSNGGAAPNDVLLAINGKVFTDFEALGNALSNQIPGEEVALTIMRAGKKRDVKVTPVER